MEQEIIIDAGITLGAVIGLTEAIKQVAERVIKVDRKFVFAGITVDIVPLLPLVIGMGVVSLLLPFPSPREIIFYGLTAGLSSMGVYSGTKTFIGK